jgi:hypothetical protein
MRINKTAGQTESWLEKFLAHAYLDSLKVVGVNEDDPFWATVPGIEHRLEEKDEVHVIGVQTRRLKGKLDEPFFELAIPELGQTGTVTFPGVLCRAALDVACREAETLLKDHRKTDITIRLVKERLERQIARG